MKYFLFVYDRRSRAVLESCEYEEGDRERALRDSFERELAVRTSPDIEVVVLGAESREALRKTHARYFMGPDELLRTQAP